MKRPYAPKKILAANGMQFVTDQKGRRVAVQLDLRKYGELWDKIEDVLISCSRQDEQLIPLDEVKKSLIKSGNWLTL